MAEQNCDDLLAPYLQRFRGHRFRYRLPKSTLWKNVSPSTKQYRYWRLQKKRNSPSTSFQLVEYASFPVYSETVGHLAFKPSWGTCRKVLIGRQDPGIRVPACMFEQCQRQESFAVLTGTSSLSDFTTRKLHACNSKFLLLIKVCLFLSKSRMGKYTVSKYRSNGHTK